MHRLLTLLAALLLIVALPVHSDAQRSRAQQRDGIPEGHARLLVITNFETAEVQINDVSYPYEYVYADREGLLVPADFPFELKVTVTAEKTRRFRLNLRNGETRVIVVGIDNMGDVTVVPTAANAEAAPKTEEDKEEEATTGFLGVSSSPRGTVVVDEANTGRRTPARRVELAPGRHRVQVIYDDGETSETKYVLIRAGTNTNVFFRQRRPAADAP